jgi:hypothetical protein
MFKESLFSICPDRTIEPVETPAGRTYVRSITVREKDAFDAAVQETKATRAQLLIHCCCKEDGSPEFDEFDLVRIGELPAGAVEPIVDAALRVNRFRPEDTEAVRKN